MLVNVTDTPDALYENESIDDTKYGIVYNPGPETIYVDTAAATATAAEGVPVEAEGDLAFTLPPGAAIFAFAAVNQPARLMVA